MISLDVIKPESDHQEVGSDNGHFAVKPSTRTSKSMSLIRRSKFMRKPRVSLVYTVSSGISPGSRNSARGGEILLIIVFFSFFFVFLFKGQVIGLLSSIEIAIWKVAPLNDKYLLKALIYIVVALTIIRHFGRNFFFW